MYSKDNFQQIVMALSRFNAKFKPNTSTQMKGVIAALYLAQNDKVLKYTNMIGLLQLDIDRKLKTKFLRLYNIETMKLAFQVELYYDFINYYNKLDDKFYFFDYPVGTIGFLFRNREEAEMMYAKIKTQAPTKKQQQQLMAQIRQNQRKKQQSFSIFGKLKKVFNKQVKPQQKSGQIMKFQVISSITMGQNGKFVKFGNTPQQMDIIDRMQLTQKQKNNPQIMQMISQQLMIHQIKKQVTGNNNTESRQILEIIKQHEQQEKNYYKDLRQTFLMNLPPPPPLPSIMAPQNRVSIKNSNRNNLMDQIRANNTTLKHVKTNQKGGINVNLASMDTVDRDDFAAAMRKKIAMRRAALGKNQDDD